MEYTSVIIGFVSLLVIFLIAITLTRLYKRATKETVFIRTGFGGEKVIMDGGALVIPILHEVQGINMTTVKLVVSKKNEEALITKDRLRADVSAEFYLRVKATKEAVSTAAQTLGSKTLNPAGLLSLMEGKLIDVLRSTAAGMDMNELHEKRVEFVQQVQQSVTEDLIKNGLELEAISLTGLDQTDIKYFNSQNVFDAEGMKKIIEQTELRRLEKNKIEQETKISIENKNLETDKKILEINREREQTKIEQDTSIKNLEAENNANVLKVAEEKRKDAELAKIKADLEINQERIKKEKELEAAKISTDKEIAIASQEKSIAISIKAQEELKAKTEENLAKADEISSQEKVITAKEKEVAEREKVLALVQANKVKEATIIEAKGKSEAIMSVAEAKQKEYQIEADGKKALVEAENAISLDIIKMKLQTELIQILPKIVENMVKPMENIDSIKIIDAKGLGGSYSSNGEVNSGSNLSNDIVNAALKYKFNVPLLDSLTKDLNMNIDLKSDKIENILNSVGESINKNVETEDSPKE